MAGVGEGQSSIDFMDSTKASIAPDLSLSTRMLLLECTRLRKRERERKGEREGEGERERKRERERERRRTRV